jgi:hypothetical protein
MKKKLLPIAFMATSFCFQTSLANCQLNVDNIPPEKNKSEGELRAERSKVLFEENKGQVKDQQWQPRPDVLYYGQSEGMSFFIRENGISYQLSQVETWKEEEPMHRHNFEKESIKVPDLVTIYRVDVNWINAQAPQTLVKGMRPGYNNYYNVSEGVPPAMYVKKYERIIFKSLWPGVDLEYFSRNGHLESDWVVHRAEDYKQIAFEIKGAALRIEGDQLIMKTPLGEIAEGALLVLQNGKEVKSRWELKDNIVQLVLEEGYDPNQPLRIDPPVRIWGTYYGGTLNDFCSSISIDDIGNVYLAGSTPSYTGIATSGSHQDTLIGGGDAYLAKFNNSGGRLWGTYYGGFDQDDGRSCSVDAFGDVYLAGTTNSPIGIATSMAHQSTFGGYFDAFLVKFNSNGVRQWGTYYGGSLEEHNPNCVADGHGNVYLSGSTNSFNNIATVGAHQSTNGGFFDAYVAKFNSSGVRQWSTYYGGVFGDDALSCAADIGGNVYLTGRTQSSNAISTLGAHQDTPIGFENAFLVKFDSSGVRQWGTYYGGSLEDFGLSCTVDNNGNIYLAGNTKSTNAIATADAHQDSHGGDWDAFLVKFNGNGTRQWGTYYGGGLEEWGNSCAVDGTGNVYLAGSTKSTTAIATTGTHQDSLGGNRDAFLVKFNGNGTRQWGTYYGGGVEDWGGSCAVESTGNTFLAGSTKSTSGIATPGAHQMINGGNFDGYFVKFYGVGSNVNVEGTSRSGTTFSIYPNPNQGRFTIQSKKGGVFELTDMTGRVIQTYQTTNDTNTIQVVVPSGVYFIRDKASHSVQKLVIE